MQRKGLVSYSGKEDINIVSIAVRKLKLDTERITSIQWKIKTRSVMPGSYIVRIGEKKKTTNISIVLKVKN